MMALKNSPVLRAGLLGSVSLMLLSATDLRPLPASEAAERCGALAELEIADAAGVTTRHVAADAGSSMPAHCLVEGMINAREGAGGVAYGIGFALALPDDWNGRFLLQGGGGMNGTVNPPIGPVASGTRPALTRGFAVISHDSGHKGAVFDASFMADQRAGLDFAEAAVETVTHYGKALTSEYYQQIIAYSYMTGCSTGGREGMLASQRYPELFDGIVAGAPAMRTGHSNLGTAFAKVQFNQAAPLADDGLPDPARAFSVADRQTIASDLLEQCDALDGIADGMIMNVAGCAFKPAALQCSSGKADDCLSPAQVGALERAFAGPVDASGHPAYVPFPWDTGVTSIAGPVSGFISSGQADILGPANRDLAFDVDGRLRQIRADGVQRLTDTHVWTNLDTFLAHGGKMLFFHGVSDAWFSAFDTADYWQRAAEANGPAWEQASRLYMVPGMAHCQSGNAHDVFDLLGPLVDWVEQGTAPDRPIASRTDGSASVPLCHYPAYAHYEGGNPAEAASYSCKAPT